MKSVTSAAFVGLMGASWRSSRGRQSSRCSLNPTFACCLLALRAGRCSAGDVALRRDPDGLVLGEQTNAARQGHRGAGSAAASHGLDAGRASASAAPARLDRRHAPRGEGGGATDRRGRRRTRDAAARRKAREDDRLQHRRPGGACGALANRPVDHLRRPIRVESPRAAVASPVKVPPVYVLAPLAVKVPVPAQAASAGRARVAERCPSCPPPWTTSHI
jgi:hypothetical protein